MKLAGGSGHAVRGVGTHPAGPHLVGCEEPHPSCPERCPLHGRDVLPHIVAAVPDRERVGQRHDLMGSGGGVHADLRVQGAAGHGLVSRVAQRVEGLRHSTLVEHDLAVVIPSVPQQSDECGGVAEVLKCLLVLMGVLPGHGRRGQARRVLDALDQESISTVEGGELIHDPHVRSTPPGGHVLRVGMQSQVLPHSGSADPSA